MIITIDGPASSGKGTAAKMLAKSIPAFHLDSGLLYRAFAYFMLHKKIELLPFSSDMLQEYMMDLHIQYDFDDQSMRIGLYHNDITDLLRTREISAKSSEIAKNAYVRDLITEKIRTLQLQFSSIVADGRDMGTVVFPHANFHFYLDASLEMRAHRRYHELLSKGFSAGTEAEILAELAQRDYQDMHRELAPLKPSERSIIIQTDSMEPIEVVELMRSYILNYSS